MNKIFDESFLTLLENKLETVLATNKTIQRKDLCKELSMDESYIDIISFAALNVLEDYEIIPGRFGGIAKKGTKGNKDATKTRNSKLTDEFMTNLKSALETLCADNKRHHRDEIAQAMGIPGDDTERLISAAIKSNLLPEYKSVRGKWGGVQLKQEENKVSTEEVSTEEVSDSQQLDDEVLVESNEDNEAVELFSQDEPEEDDYDLSDLDEEVRQIIMQQDAKIKQKEIVL